ncbi:hypothetical protein [Streptomyces sp. NPDC012616]|uniref:hypothetical protein n=1 Tax=Streptomyces sp. NPDC012616 TaxID=3364840 RepID=UPI0036E091EE
MLQLQLGFPQPGLQVVESMSRRSYSANAWLAMRIRLRISAPLARRFCGSVGSCGTVL